MPIDSAHRRSSPKLTLSLVRAKAAVSLMAFAFEKCTATCANPMPANQPTFAVLDPTQNKLLAPHRQIVDCLS